MTTLGEAFIPLRADSSGFAAEMDAGLKRATAGKSVSIPVVPDSQLARTRMAALVGQLSAIAGRLGNIKVGVDDKKGRLQLDSLMLRAARLQDRLGNMRLDLKGTLSAQVSIDRL